MKLIRFLAGINLKIITVLLLLTYLNLEAEQLYVYVKPQYSKIWKDLIQNYKLPGGTEVIKLTSPEYNTHGNFSARSVTRVVFSGDNPSQQSGGNLCKP